MKRNGLTLRELGYDLLDQGRRAGDFPLERDAIDRIAAGMIYTLNDREDVRGPFDHNERENYGKSSGAPQPRRRRYPEAQLAAGTMN
jgi:hypothetical protein